MVLAPEHELVNTITTTEQKEEVDDYVNTAKLKSERDRQSDKSVSGVFTGSYAIHPFTGEIKCKFGLEIMYWLLTELVR